MINPPDSARTLLGSQPRFPPDQDVRPPSQGKPLVRREELWVVGQASLKHMLKLVRLLGYLDQPSAVCYEKDTHGKTILGRAERTQTPRSEVAFIGRFFPGDPP